MDTEWFLHVKNCAHDRSKSFLFVLLQWLAEVSMVKYAKIFCIYFFHFWCIAQDSLEGLDGGLQKHLERFLHLPHTYLSNKKETPTSISKLYHITLGWCHFGWSHTVLKMVRQVLDDVVPNIGFCIIVIEGFREMGLLTTLPC